MTHTNFTNNLKDGFFLPQQDIQIKESIEMSLIYFFHSDEEVEKHLKYHFYKYLFVVDYISRKNLKYSKKCTQSQTIEFDYLYKKITNKISLTLPDGKRITLTKLILDVLQLAKIIKKTRMPNRNDGICSEYRVVFDANKRIKFYECEFVWFNKHQSGFTEKVQKLRQKEISINTPVQKKMFRWLNQLDFSRVWFNKLSTHHQLIYTLFHTWKFQVQGKTGRIYNNFTNLPKTIRENLRVDGFPLSEADLANAQAIFLVDVIKSFMNSNNELPDAQTQEFILWAELGKAFEFLNGKLPFVHGATRTSLYPSEEPHLEG